MKKKRCRSLCPRCRKNKYIVGDARCEEEQGHDGAHMHSDYPHNSDRIVTHRWKRKNRNGQLVVKNEKVK